MTYLKDGATWFSYDECKRPDGPLCVECGTVWNNGYKYMTQEACIGAFSSDPEFEKCFNTSKQIQKGDQKLTCNPGTVAASTDTGYRIERRFYAFTKKKFRERYRVEPEQVQHKPVELRDEFGDAFNPYLVEANEGGAHCMVVFYYNKNNECAEMHQRAETTLHEGQLAETYKALTGDFKKGLVRKVGKVLTDEVLRAKARDVVTSQGFEYFEPPPLTGAPQPGFLTPEPLRLPAAAVTPKASRGASADGLEESEVASPASAAGTVAPPMSTGSFAAGRGFSARSSTVGEDGCQKEGPARTVPEHISKLDLSRIIGGSKGGSARRWAEAFVLKHPNDPSIDLLKSHLRAANSCEKLASAGAVQLSDRELEMHLAEVEQHEVDMPTEVKLMLVQRKVNMWVNRTDRFDRVGDLLSLVVPWVELAEASKEIPMFNPLMPAMASIEGSPAEKSMRFVETLVHNLLVPAMKGGEQKGPETLKLCASVVGALEQVGDIDEEYSGCMCGLLTVFRVVQSVASGMYVDGCTPEDLTNMEKAIVDKTSSNYSGVVAAVMVEVDYYSEKKAELKKYAIATGRHKSEVDECMAALSVEGGVRDSAALWGHLAIYEKVAGKVATCMVDALETSLKFAAEAFANAAAERLGKTKMSAETLDGLMTVGTKANMLLGKTDAFTSLISKVAEQQHLAKRNTKIDRFADACAGEMSTLETFGPSIDEKGRARLLRLATELRGTDVSGGNAVIEAFLRKLVLEIAAMSDPSTAMDAKDLVMELAGLSGFCKQVEITGMPSLVMTDAFLCTAGKALQILKGLADLQESDNGLTDKKFIELSAGIEEYNKSVAGITGAADMMFFKQASLKFGAWCTDVADERLRRQGEMVAKTAAELKPLSKGACDEHSWRADLSHTASFMDMYKVGKDTLLKGPGLTLTKLCNELDTGLSRWKELGEMHGRAESVLKSESFVTCGDTLRIGRATVIEAAILKSVYQDRANAVKMKQHMTNYLKKAATWECKALLHPVFEAAFELAKVYRLKLG